MDSESIGISGNILTRRTLPCHCCSCCISSFASMVVGFPIRKVSFDVRPETAISTRFVLTRVCNGVQGKSIGTGANSITRQTFEGPCCSCRSFCFALMVFAFPKHKIRLDIGLEATIITRLKLPRVCFSMLAERTRIGRNIITRRTRIIFPWLFLYLAAGKPTRLSLEPNNGQGGCCAGVSFF